MFPPPPSSAARRRQRRRQRHREPGKLSYSQSQPESQLKFIIEAWLQMVECRRVLKWTNAYGYYLPEHEQAKRRFFEYLQGEAESGLERLHQCAEKEFQVYLEAVTPVKDFNDFHTKLAGLTSVTRNYFENFVRAFGVGPQGRWIQQPSAGQVQPDLNFNRTQPRF